ncbi:hypothetical protein AVDCRST_MAG82-119 [uncultured Rubrobacteraceae bacterium]|uniref:Uncharacterized protein n=1 Tax=uncultured Rubrobacteraceae bacterium TaxID=349277 RepID=A0A6J4NWQ4_9ACTN|nr:hypothetical protein AVDCRST_MAG82-119 [uncultured Rubrobacteraceae bacterium]
MIAEVEAGGAGDRAGLLEALARAGEAADLRIMRGGRITAMEASLAESGRAA